MRKKICIPILVMLLITVVIPFNVIAGDEENPEIKDRRLDVKLFGIIGGIPQSYFKHIDIISGWFYEDNNEPDYLFVSLKMRDLQSTSDTLEALYSVCWIYNHVPYQTVVKLHSNGIFGSYYVVVNNDKSYSCEGTLDIEDNIITWRVPKDIIGNPQPGESLTTTSAYALLRPYDESTNEVGADIFKDLTNRLVARPSEKYGDDYIIIN
jgi:hypothetical protein